MLFVLYPLYLLIVAAVLLRARRSWSAAGRLAEWRVAAAQALALPVAAGAAVLGLAGMTERAEVILALPLTPGIALLAFGFALAHGAPDLALELRIAGWSLVAGLALVPSSLVLLAPLAGLALYAVLAPYGSAARSV